jgi:hypothetical protein
MALCYNFFSVLEFELSLELAWQALYHLSYLPHPYYAFQVFFFAYEVFLFLKISLFFADFRVVLLYHLH